MESGFWCARGGLLFALAQGGRDREAHQKVVQNIDSGNTGGLFENRGLLCNFLGEYPWLADEQQVKDDRLSVGRSGSLPTGNVRGYVRNRSVRNSVQFYVLCPQLSSNTTQVTNRTTQGDPVRRCQAASRWIAGRHN